MRQRVWIAILIASLGWGTGGVATRAAFDENLGPFGVVGLRAIVATLAVIGYLLYRGGGVPRSRLVWKVGVVQGLGNFALPFVLFTLAYENASAGFVGLIAALIPIVTAVFAHFILGTELLTRFKLVGLVLAFAGVAVLGLSGDSGLGDEGKPILALSLGIVAVVILSLAGIYAKYHAGSYDSVELTWVQFVSGTGVLLVALMIFEGWPTDTTVEGWGLIVYMGLAATFIPFVLFFWMLRYTTITQASLVGYLVPIIAVIAGVVLVNERLEPGIIAGGILILAGVIIADRAETAMSRPPPETALPMRPGSPTTGGPPPPTETMPTPHPRQTQ